MKDKIDQIWGKVLELAPHLKVLFEVVLIVLAAFVVERVLVSLLRAAHARSKAGGSEDLTRYRFFRNALRFIVGIAAMIAVIWTIPSIRSLAVTLFAGAGIIAALIGLSAQKAFSNIISGVFIVAFKPFRVGDNILFGTEAVGQGQPDRGGIVEDITLRHTVILTFENRRVIVPNAIISDQVIINSTIRDPATCEYIEVPVAYDTDLEKATTLLREICQVHPERLDRRTADELEKGMDDLPVRLVRLTDSALVLRAYVWARDPVVARIMHYDLNRVIIERFREAGIEVPYPHRVVLHQDRTAVAVPHEEGSPA